MTLEYRLQQLTLNKQFTIVDYAEDDDSEDCDFVYQSDADMEADDDEDDAGLEQFCVPEPLYSSPNVTMNLPQEKEFTLNEQTVRYLQNWANVEDDEEDSDYEPVADETMSSESEEEDEDEI